MFLYSSVVEPDDKTKIAEKTKKSGTEIKLPAESEPWFIELDGYAGTPGDRSNFRWTLSHDGAFEIYSGRKKSGSVGKATLTLDECHRVYASIAKILKE